MKSEQQQYHQAVKATSLFGGVQVFNIIIQIIRSKLVAMLLGPAGMGVIGIFTATTNFIGSLTNFGLGISAVRDIVAANESGNQARTAEIMGSFRKMLWLTGLLGSVLTLVFAPWLSELSFGNHDFTLAFMLLAVTLLLTQLNTGNMVILQGMRQLNFLAKSNMLGSVIGLLLTIPLFWWLGQDGIVPGLIVSAITAFLISRYFCQKIAILKDSRIGWSLAFNNGKEMMRMGFLISLSGILTLGISYILNIFINRQGGVEEVGFYNAGFSIINTYVGMVFTAMGTDYYPRLSSVSHDVNKTNLAINQQMEIALLILTPILIAFLLLIKPSLIIMYSSKFLKIEGMLSWTTLGMIFKAASWSLAFLFLSKGVSMLYFWNELLGNVYMLALNIWGYLLDGLSGIGFSFAIGYLIYLIQVLCITRYKFKFSFSARSLQVLFISIIMLLLALAASYVLPNIFKNIFRSILLLLSLYYSFFCLDKTIGLKKILYSKLKTFIS